MEIGSRIKKLRLELNLTQEELAERVGIDKRNISRYEGGHVDPRKSTLRKMAEVFGITYEEMTGPVEIVSHEIPEDPELLKLFTGVANLPKDKKDALMRVMEIVVREHRIQSAIAS
tara:strand:- start:46 stop:393 length:348 start_codon:yes stop_codon:yes gene_type:complete